MWKWMRQTHRYLHGKILQFGSSGGKEERPRWFSAQGLGGVEQREDRQRRRRRHWHWQRHSAGNNTYFVAQELACKTWGVIGG